ncbi:cytochrome P450 [Corynascus similis CBS 632.67]
MAASLILLAFPLLLTYLAATIWHRRFRQFAHFPQLKPSLLWGHLQTIHEYTLRAKPKIHVDPVFAQIAKDLGNPPLMYFDLRPVSYPMVVVNSHEIAEQVSRVSKQFAWSTPKSPTLGDLVRVIGPESILMRQNEDWKQLRKRFNPGFAPQHLMTLLGCICDKTMIFIDHLERYARSGKEFPLNKLTINLTFDIIGAITMDEDFDAQQPESSGQGEFIKLYDQLLKMYNNEDSRFPWWTQPKREWRRYKLGKQIDMRLDAMIREKHAKQQQKQDEQNAGKRKPRDVLSLSLQGSSELSQSLLAETRDQIKTFLFAGHDTTGILLAWLFYELSRTPHVLKAVREELDGIFGPDPDPVAVREKLLAPNGEELINKMPYINSVIKEILRLRPPAGTARMAPPGTGFNVRTPDGQSFCLDGVIIYNCATIIQRDRTVFGDTADDFVPERWLGDKGIMSADADQNEAAGSRKFPPGAWRPFERGPRNCIGQDLATIEARVIVALVARQYDFVKVGLGEIDLDEKGQPTVNEKGQYKTKSELYNTTQVTAKPVDAMMMKVKRRA